MNPNKFNQNNVVFFVHGAKIVKGVIDELIIHYTQKDIIIKYLIRPYGMEQFVTIDEDNVYVELENAKEFIVSNLNVKYCKEDITKNYEEALEKITSQYRAQYDGFDENLAKTVESVQGVSESYFDELEKEYQESLTEENV